MGYFKNFSKILYYINTTKSATTNDLGLWVLDGNYSNDMTYMYTASSFKIPEA